MNKTLREFLKKQEDMNLHWRPEYWMMSMLAALEIAKAISEVAMELRKTRLNLL